MKKQLNIKITKDGDLTVSGAYVPRILKDILYAYVESVGGIDNYIKERDEIIGGELDVTVTFDLAKDDTGFSVEPKLDGQKMKLFMLAIGEILMDQSESESDKYEFDA